MAPGGTGGSSARALGAEDRDQPDSKCPPGDRATSGTRATPPSDRDHGLPLVVIRHPDGTTRPAPFLMNPDEVAAFFRLHESRTKFPEKTIQRYRRMGLRTVRVGRRVWFRLDDVLRFLDDQQDRLSTIGLFTAPLGSGPVADRCTAAPRTPRQRSRAASGFTQTQEYAAGEGHRALSYLFCDPTS